MRIKKPKPRKVQKYQEFWYNPDTDSIYWVPLPPYLPRYFDIHAKHECFQWVMASFYSAIFRLKGKKREGWGKFEFIGEVKP